MSSPREAEMAKLIENTFRHVNIALMSELGFGQLWLERRLDARAGPREPLGQPCSVAPRPSRLGLDDVRGSSMAWRRLFPVSGETGPLAG